MDAYKLGEDLAALTCSLVPVLVIAAAVAVTWWAIARARRERAKREHRNEPPYPYISSDRMYYSQPSTDEPSGTTERLADSPHNEPMADHPRSEPPMSGQPAG